MEDEFRPQPGADGWQLSNPPILQLAALRGSLELFDRATLPAIARKASQLTALALRLLDQLAARVQASQAPGSPAVLEVLTPRNPAHRGAQLSVRLAPGTLLAAGAGAHGDGGGDGEFDRAEAVQRLLAERHGVEVDYRRPHVLRFGFVGLYCSYRDVLLLMTSLEACLRTA